MNSKKEALVRGQIKKSIDTWIALSNKASKKEMKRVVSLFQSVVRLDGKNEIIIPYRKGLLPKGMGVKHLSILLACGLYKRLNNIQMHKRYLAMENRLMRKLQ